MMFDWIYDIPFLVWLGGVFAIMFLAGKIKGEY